MEWEVKRGMPGSSVAGVQAFSGGEKCDRFLFAPRKMRIVSVEEDVYHWNFISILRAFYC